jgi:hypothetical protein
MFSLLRIILNYYPKIKYIPKKSPLHGVLYSATGGTEDAEKEAIIVLKPQIHADKRRK